MPVQQRNDGMVQLLGADFQKRHEPNFAFAQAIGMLQMFPGVVGIWPGSVTDGAGQMVDVSGNSNHLTNNNTATFNNSGTDLIPYVECLAASTQYFSHSDGAPFDILGTEAYITSTQRGLTLGAWVYFDSVGGTTPGIIGKWASAGNQKAYHLSLSSGVVTLFLSSDGATTSSLSAGITPATGRWYFIAGKLTPSTEYYVRINGDEYTSTTAVIASIFNSTAPFTIGNLNGVFLSGRISLAFLCAAAVPDVFIETLYQQSRALFGV